MATQTEVGKHLDLSDRSVRELLERGVLPNAARGALDLDWCRTSYIRHLREMAAGRATGPAGDDLTSERARLAREQADNIALKNAALRKELLPRSDITRAVVAAFQIVRDRLSALPARLAGPLAATTDPAEVRGRLSDAVNGVLVELSETRVVATVEEPADAA
ncbi:hypothetical protein [Azospirillum brasilense]|uniref:hypothetical protein n=1 Tax=Azospirillum brasilense TaxID=192 RepID=UPI000E680862|nr:hypothetical protein [Azospirillum brasilense]NUB25732.1 hypothetical protein [Azospirillum brasilense]NUB33870.1 hypothetical protein [Azospirillum brasilense]RIW07756.1 hypothetical protein D2T81_02645 [Azospirillum brasilense]